jgi:hypothetical protein
VDLPRRDRARVFIRGITPPQTLDQRRGRLTPPDHMFLTLLLLNLESKAGAKYTLKEIM